MDGFVATQGLLLGLMGWAATVLWIQGAARLTPNDRKAMVVCCWMLWMAPAFGTLALRGVLSTDLAALYVGLTTGALGVIMLLSVLGRPRTRP